MLSFVAVVMSSCSLFLSCHREVADTLHITDDTGQIINIMAMALRTFLEIMLADVTAGVADGVRDIECKVIASLYCSDLEKLTVLGF